MKDTRLLKIFNDTKDILCRYDYYIHTAKRILHLTHSYNITKIVRRDKVTKQAEVIYQSEQTTLREKSGIKKMLNAGGIKPEEKLVRYIMKLNVKFGEYHTFYMLSDEEQLMQKCCDKRDEALVKKFINIWKKRIDGI